MAPIPVLIDTDPAISIFGADVDDALAIVLALNSEKLEIDGITTVFGNTNVENTYRIAKELMKIANRQDIPVYKGAYNHTWLKVRSPAVQFLIEHIMEHPGEITLIALAPLTNIASAFLLEPRLAENLRSLLIMGGLFFPSRLQYPFIRSEFNFSSDGLATKIVLDQDIDTTIIGLDVTSQVCFSDVHYVALQQAETSMAKFLAKHLKYWLILNKILLGRGFYPHDPIAVAYLIKKSLFKMITASLDVYVSKRKKSLPKFAHKRYSNSLPFVISHLLRKDGQLSVTIPPNDSRKHKFKIGISVNEKAFLKLLIKELTK